MQTILGAGGAIGTELAKALSDYTSAIRLVSRQPQKVNEKDELFPADLTDRIQIDKAIEGSEVVYLTVGFDYDIRVWREKWPNLMRNVIDSCHRHNAKLVFFDNVYMYDRNAIPHMTESSPVNPTSKKGKIRTEIAGMLTDAVKKGKIEGLIARSADFIAPKNSVVVEMVYKNLKLGKKAQWFVSVDKIHNFTVAPDAGKATAKLGNTKEAFGRVWHLPSVNARLTGKQWIELFAGELNSTPRYTVIPVWMLSFMGLFVRMMKEFAEMAYQYESDYFFDSTDFEKTFGYTPMSPLESVRYIIETVH